MITYSNIILKAFKTNNTSYTITHQLNTHSFMNQQDKVFFKKKKKDFSCRRAYLGLLHTLTTEGASYNIYWLFAYEFGFFRVINSHVALHGFIHPLSPST